MTVSLLYHDIAPAADRDDIGFPGPLAARYKLTPDEFEAHLDALSATGVAFASLAREPFPAAALTFDDGGISALDAAARLARRGWVGHFFVTTGRIGTPGFLDADGVRCLRDDGHVVGSHSHDHPTYMGKLSPSEILDQWTISRDALADILGAPPRTASVPGGFVSAAVIDAAERAGYTLLMTSDPTTRVRRHGTLSVLGRFAIRSSTPDLLAARYASGSPLACGRQWLEWKAKAVPKQVSPRLYERARRLRASRR